MIRSHTTSICRRTRLQPSPCARWRDVHRASITIQANANQAAAHRGAADRIGDHPPRGAADRLTGGCMRSRDRRLRPRGSSWTTRICRACCRMPLLGFVYDHASVQEHAGVRAQPGQPVLLSRPIRRRRRQPAHAGQLRLADEPCRAVSHGHQRTRSAAESSARTRETPKRAMARCTNRSTSTIRAAITRERFGWVNALFEQTFANCQREHRYCRGRPLRSANLM